MTSIVSFPEASIAQAYLSHVYVLWMQWPKVTLPQSSNTQSPHSERDCEELVVVR